MVTSLYIHMIFVDMGICLKVPSSNLHKAVYV